ncbi:MAG: hypothetical protein J0M03_10605 [Acidobacteria bacterium]|nr:hypothetical protein [Acidobacteriota bacterium]
MENLKYNNVLTISGYKYNSLSDDYQSYLEEFYRLRKIKPENLSTEEKMLLETLTLLIAFHQEKLYPSLQKLDNIDITPSLLAA